MSLRLKKQIIYGILMLTVFISGIFIIYLFFKKQPAASCYDGILNQGEEDVDCGGPCPPCEIKYLKPIIIYPANFITYPNSSFLDLVGFVENQNENLGLEKLKYYFELYDLQDKLIAKTETKETPLPPLSKVIITYLNYPIPTSDINKVKLIVIEPKKEEWLKLNPEKLPIVYYNERLEKEQNVWKFSISLFNKGFIPYDIEMNVLIYDEVNNLIGISKSLVNIKPQEIKNLIISFNNLSKHPKGFGVYLQRTKLLR